MQQWQNDLRARSHLLFPVVILIFDLQSLQKLKRISSEKHVQNVTATNKFFKLDLDRIFHVQNTYFVKISNFGVSWKLGNLVYPKSASFERAKARLASSFSRDQRLFLINSRPKLERTAHEVLYIYQISTLFPF